MLVTITRGDADRVAGGLNRPPYRGKFEDHEPMDRTRCRNCYNYWNHTCGPCAICNSSDYTPCIHCDYGLR